MRVACLNACLHAYIMRIIGVRVGRGSHFWDSVPDPHNKFPQNPSLTASECLIILRYKFGPIQLVMSACRARAWVEEKGVKKMEYDACMHACMHAWGMWCMHAWGGWCMQANECTNCREYYLLHGRVLR